MNHKIRTFLVEVMKDIALILGVAAGCAIMSAVFFGLGNCVGHLLVDVFHVNWSPAHWVKPGQTFPNAITSFGSIILMFTVGGVAVIVLLYRWLRDRWIEASRGPTHFC